MNNVVKNSKTSPKKSVTAKQLAKSNLTKRKNPDWDNLDRGYRYLTLDMKLPHDLAVAVMGNVVEESLGNYKSVLKNGGGRGLIQWDGRKAPNGRYSLWGSIWASVAKPANVYDSTTDTVKNYWAPWRGLKGDEVRLKFIKAPLKEKAKIYAESYLRPGKPRIADRQLSTMQLDSIYNPRIKDVIVLKDGGYIRKMLTAAGGPIQKQKYLNEALLFAEDYRNSPGFKEKWNRIGKVPGTYRIKNSKYNPLLNSEHKLLWKIGPFKKGNYIPWKEDPKNSMYKYGNGDFYIGTSKKPGDAFSNWKDVLTHEAGHYLEESLNNPTLIYKNSYTTNSPLNFYSEIYPVFRKSNSYKNVLNFISDDKENVSEYNQNPVTKSWSFNYDWGTDDLHDASPSESYADLFLLRKKLLDSGVYDIRKANNPFTKLHLEQFKKKNKDKIRLFDNFSDEDIIWMMNNVAQNNMNNNNNLNLYAKQGGKMNIIDFLKNGSGIHIKEKNKGKFTKYCHGKVTDECILKGKNSSNPTIRKRAIFAANARKWKHKNGGVFKAADGAKTNIWLKIGNGLNSGWGQLAINIGSSYLLNKALNKQIDYNLEMSDASLDMEKNELKKLVPYQALLMALLMLGQINPENPNEKGGIFAEVIPAKLRDLLNGQIDLEYANKKSLNKVQALLLKNQNNSNFILGIGLNLGSMLLNINFSKKSNNLTTSIEQPVANNFLAGYNQFTLKPDYSYMLLQ